jgi:hypothetical protein
VDAFALRSRIISISGNPNSDILRSLLGGAFLPTVAHFPDPRSNTMRSRSMVLSLTVLAAWPALNALAQLDKYSGASSTFSIVNKTDVPGKALNPGDYSIKVVDELTDRMIVRVENQTTKDYAILLGVPHAAPADAVTPGPLDWKAGPGGSPALRGFSFAPGLTVEFVYPKNEAVEIATQNAGTVIAVDPVSQGLPPMKNLSKDDLRMVELWGLSMAPVGPDNKAAAIQAKKYQVELPVGGRPVPPQQVASLNQPSTGSQSDMAAVAPAKRPVVAKLPHTASPVALIAFCGIFCLTAAGSLRLGSIIAIRSVNQG